MAKVKKVKSNIPVHLKLAHERRREQSAKVAKMTPDQRTKELGPVIVDKAIKAIRKVGVLATAKVLTGQDKDGNNVYRSKYTISAEQKQQVISTLRNAVDQLDGRLTPGEKGAKSGEFSFS